MLWIFILSIFNHLYLKNNSNAIFKNSNAVAILTHYLLHNATLWIDRMRIAYEKNKKWAQPIPILDKILIDALNI